MAERVAELLEQGGQTARTVTTKVRYPDFSIRSRSTTLPVATDDARRLAELACGLLDRALADRPGALRLVGVAVSGLEDHRQLALLALVLFGRPARDVPDRDDSDRSVALDHRNVAKAALEHDLGRLFRRRRGCQRDGIGRHPLPNARLARVGSPSDRAGEIALRQDSDQPSVIRDRRGADLAVDHLLCGLADRVLWGHGQDVARHQIGQRAHRKREHRRKQRCDLLRVQSCVLEVEVSCNADHHVVVDPAFAAERDHGCTLGVEQLAEQALVGLRLLLDRTVVVL